MQRNGFVCACAPLLRAPCGRSGPHAHTVKKNNLTSHVNLSLLLLLRYKPLAGGSVAAMVINTGANTTALSCKLGDLGVTKAPKAITDLWANKPVTITAGAITASNTLCAQCAIGVK